MKKAILIYVVCSIILLSGCASTQIKQTERGDVYERVAAPVNTAERAEDSGAYVVRARRLTRLELKKKEAIRQNDKSTVSVVAGTIAAITAYTISNADFNSKSQLINGVGTMCITAAAAYLAAWAAGVIDDLFTVR
jgi:uncharacterized protein YceK